MEKFKDIWASVVSQIHERTTNPLTFSFIVSWLIWNYRFVYISFSELPIKEKFILIKSYYPDWHMAGQEGFLYPLLTSLAYVFIYPFITIYVVNYYRDHQIRLANSIKKLEKQRLLTNEEATFRQREYEKSLALAQEAELAAETELNSVREVLKLAEEEITSLNLKINPKTILEVYNPQKIDRKSSPESPEQDVQIVETTDENLFLNFPVQGVMLKDNTLTIRQLKILSLMSEGDRISVNQIAIDIGISKFYSALDIDFLHKSELISHVVNDDYKINSKGRLTLNAFIAQGVWPFSK